MTGDAVILWSEEHMRSIQIKTSFKPASEVLSFYERLRYLRTKHRSCRFSQY